MISGATSAMAVVMTACVIIYGLKYIIVSVTHLTTLLSIDTVTVDDSVEIQNALPLEKTAKTRAFEQ